jgi:hypothetical protein
MHGMRTGLAILLAVLCGVFGGCFAVQAPRLDQAFWFDHVSTVISFLPLFLLARTWKWLICGIPGLVAGALILAFRDDLANRWPELTRGPIIVMLGAWLLSWLPGKVVVLWKGGPRYAEYAAGLAEKGKPFDGNDTRRRNPYFFAGVICLLILPVWTVFAIFLVWNQNWGRNDSGRALLAISYLITLILLTGGILLPFLGWVRQWRFRSRVLPWMQLMLLLLALILPVQFLLLWFLQICVNGIFPGGGK